MLDDDRAPLTGGTSWAHWRAANAPHLAALVRAGALLVERPDESGPEQQVA